MVGPSKQEDSQIVVGRLSAAVIAFVLAALFLAAAAAFYYSFHLVTRMTDAISERIDESPLAESAALDFLTDLKMGRLEAAYERTTSRFKKQWSPKEFRNFISRHPGFRDNTGRVDHFESENGRTLLHTTLLSEEGEVRCMIEVIEEGRLWQVDQLRLP
jgi:hypothetical protein